MNNDEAKYRVMIVEDSSVVRNLLGKIINETSDLNLIETAENGRDAIDKITNARPDILLLDVEMPVMDGLTALPVLLNKSPDTKIIMVSTLTSHNARISITALEKGASDYLQKPSSNTVLDEFKKELLQKIYAIARKKPIDISYQSKVEQNDIEDNFKPEVLAIGSSTGGPQALATLFRGLPHSFNNVPIFLTQHMPPKFTTFLASSIENSSGRTCIEAKDGEHVKNGNIYIAPGDYHMLIKGKKDDLIINLTQTDPENFCRPSVDPMLRSLVDIYGSNILTVILTGMGQDGLLGSKKVVENGGRVIIQDEATSVVWGMPGAIAKAGIYHKMLPINQIASKIVEIFAKGGIKDGS
ncbi:chemotaxis response regulator protein-glutamate methylesterase [Rickettsiales bacterium]|nr:chemotaxis response regulator protein-glutamate methylesterase [Rickettsiales bacterium]